MSKRWWLLGVPLGLGIAATFYFTRQPAAPSSSVATYVDPASCAGCHAEIARTYQLTGMGRSFHLATPREVPSAKYYHKPSDSYFTIEERGGHFYQGRYQLGPDGQKTNVLEKEIHYVLGSGNHARAFLTRTSRNTLVELPLAWYSEKGGSWGMNPAYDRPDHPGFRRNITYACAFCHNGIPTISSAVTSDPVFPAKLPEGIDCQRCHGPGSEHVRRAEGGSSKVEEIRGAIVNPAKLPPDRQLEVCMQCHLETTSFRLPNAIVRYERGPFSYRPGEPLADFVLHFDEASGKGREDKFEIASAAYRLRQSTCFLKSESKLTCTTCHNPHNIPRGEEAASHYTAVCRTCHTGGFEQLVKQGRHSASADCTSCHMPKRRAEDAVHVVMTDHKIQRKKPARDLLAPLAERRETEESGYRGEVALYYPRELPNDPQSELYLAIAQVSQKSNLSAGIEQLSAAIKKHLPTGMEYTLHLADARNSAGQTDAAALPLYEEAARRDPSSLVALQKLAAALRSAGQSARAAEVLKQALQVAPSDPVSWHQLGMSHIEQGHFAEAVAAFQTAIKFDPDMAEAHNSIGGAWLESGKPAEAEAAFREAIRLQPDYAEAHGNLGSALAASNHFEDARFHYVAAIRLKPGYTTARYNFALALARANHLDEAQAQVEELLKTEPKSAQAHDLLGNLFAAKGRAPAARDQFVEAVRLDPTLARAQLDLGSLLAESGETAAAIPHLQEAAKSPQPAMREQALQLLRRLPASR